jgi:hypothetical protein
VATADWNVRGRLPEKAAGSGTSSAAVADLPHYDFSNPVDARRRSRRNDGVSRGSPTLYFEILPTGTFWTPSEAFPALISRSSAFRALANIWEKLGKG